MPLGPGARYGAYEIGDCLGVGGMGEVYRARDTRLSREVAIKVLPDAFARDAIRLARFQREAQLLAALNHPNIAAIYGLEEQNDFRYLVLEYVPGETLAERLRRGAVPIDEATGICRQIAEALEAAHEKGIVHRDLKPANIKITPEGKVKVLDFGLAKDMAPAAATAGPTAISDAPTITSPAQMTGAGVILGTAAYMSPEQARGKQVDKRTDIWAFGCLLYEMLCGRRPFGGETVTDVMAAIVRSEPDWSAVPAATPARLHLLLRRCLQKEPRQRLHDMGDARLELDEPAESAVRTKATSPSRMPWMASAVLAVIAAAATVWGVRARSGDSPRPTTRAIIDLPPKTNLLLGRGSTVAFSPDGKRLAYIAASAGSPALLYLRSADQLDATPMPGTADATNPFFSPDGQWIGFFAERKLKKISVLGGAPVVICDAPNPRGESWAPGDTILFTPASNSAIWRVPASGGSPQEVTKLAKGEMSHRWPQVLPGGRAVLFTIWNDTGFDNGSIALQSLETEKRTILARGGSYGRYVPGPDGAGYLVYAHNEGLLAAPLDPGKGALTGPAVPVLDGVNTNLSGGAHLALSAGGTLAYVPGAMSEAERTLLWVDRKGVPQLAAQLRTMSLQFRLSPNERRVAGNSTYGFGRDVWIYDLDRKASTRFTFAGDNSNAIWTPDGKRITYASGLPVWNIFWKAVDGSGAEERLTTGASSHYPRCWSPDGKLLVYLEVQSNQGPDIWILNMTDRTTRPFLKTPFSETEPAISPDGKWLAYSSNESGRFEIYVQPFPSGGRKWQVSVDGGFAPLWSRDGHELYFRNFDKMMAVRVTTAPEFSADTPQLLFEGRYDGEYDVARDGRFLMMRGREQDKSPSQLYLVVNWLEELAQRTGKVAR